MGSAVIITLPLGCLKAGDISFQPALPDWKTDAIAKLGNGNLNKVGAESGRQAHDDLAWYPAAAQPQRAFSATRLISAMLSTEIKFPLSLMAAPYR